MSEEELSYLERVARDSPFLPEILGVIAEVRRLQHLNQASELQLKVFDQAYEIRRVNNERLLRVARAAEHLAHQASWYLRVDYVVDPSGAGDSAHDLLKSVLAFNKEREAARDLLGEKCE